METSAKWKRLEAAGIHIVEAKGPDGRVDLWRLMKLLGAGEIPGVGKLDSILLEGGGNLNESALQAGIVQEIKAFIAPKIFGGGGKSPVEGMGIQVPAEAQLLELEEIQKIGEDLLLEYRVRKGGEACSQES